MGGGFDAKYFFAPIQFGYHVFNYAAADAYGALLIANKLVFIKRKLGRYMEQSGQIAFAYSIASAGQAVEICLGKAKRMVQKRLNHKHPS